MLKLLADQTASDAALDQWVAVIVEVTAPRWFGWTRGNVPMA